ncbi:unnamed protein product [Prunus armeniaca]
MLMSLSKPQKLLRLRGVEFWPWMNQMLLVGKDLPPLDWKTLRLIARHRGRCSLQFPGLGSTSQVPSSLRRHSTNPQLMAGKLLMCLLSRTLSPALRSTR